MFADIIVDLSVEALDRTFQYIIPKQWEGEVFAGCCVKIPFGRGNRLIRGYVMNITDQAAWPVERMKEISEIEKKELPVESKLIQLAAWIRQRYGTTMNEALKTVLPIRRQIKSVEEHWLTFAMEKNKVNAKKAVMIGCGFVGSASVFALMQSGLFTEIVLIDADRNKAEGEAMDISHGIPFASPMRIYAGDYDDVADAGIVIISAGAGQKPGETRLDLVNKNVAIFKSIIPEIAKRNFNGILLVVANPVDILTQVAIKLSGLPEQRVIGSGTVLDSARLKYKLGEHLSVDSRSVHAFIVGEHGDSEVVAWSSANVSGVELSEMCEMRGHYQHKENTREIADAVKNSAYEIINRKHATYYGIAMSVRRICEVIMRDEKSILPVSHMIHGAYGIEDVVLSMPAIVGADGVETDIPIKLSGEEALKLKESADALKEILASLEL